MKAHLVAVALIGILLIAGVASATAPITQVVDPGSQSGGTFPGSIESDDGDFLTLQEEGVATPQIQSWFVENEVQVAGLCTPDLSNTQVSDDTYHICEEGNIGTPTFLMIPTGPTTVDEGFTPVGAPNEWEATDDFPHNGDTDYVEFTNAISTNDLLMVASNPSQFGSSIVSVTVRVACRAIAASTNVATEIRTHGTDFFGTLQACPPPAGGTTYTTYTTIYNVNPFTNGAWTNQEIIDLEIGVRTDSGITVTGRITSIIAQVDWADEHDLETRMAFNSFIPAFDTGTITFEARVDTSGETFQVQVRDMAGFNTRMTFSLTADETKVYVLNPSEVAAFGGGLAEIRILDGLLDPIQTEFQIDFINLTTITFLDEDFALTAEYAWNNLSATQRALRFRYVSENENPISHFAFQVLTGETWNTRGTFSETVEERSLNYTLTVPEWRNGAPKVRIIDTDGVESDATQDDISFDLIDIILLPPNPTLELISDLVVIAAFFFAFALLIIIALLIKKRRED